MIASKSASGSDGGRTIESSASRGAAPIAARSLRLTASARCRIASGGTTRRSKCTPSTSASTDRTSTRLRSGSTTAASSPMPTSIHSGDGCSCSRMRAISVRSERLSTVGATALRNNSQRGSFQVFLPLLRRSSSSLRVVDGTRLADHRHLDLARILELVLNPPRDVLRQPDRLFVRDLLALDHDADLAPGLEGERFRDAFERVGNSFELLEPLYIRLEDVAAGAGPGRGDGVRCLHDHRLERRPVDVHVMGRHRHHDRLAFAVAAQEVDTDLQVRAFHLAIDRLADIVDERGTDRNVGVEPDLTGHDAGQPRDLGGMCEHVLPVAGAVLEAAHQPVDFRVKIVQPELEGDRGAFLAHRLVGLLLDLLYDLLDSRRVDAAVGNQPLDRLFGDLAAVGVEAGQDDRAWRVVDDQVDA